MAKKKNEKDLEGMLRAVTRAEEVFYFPLDGATELVEKIKVTITYIGKMRNALVDLRKIRRWDFSAQIRQVESLLRKAERNEAKLIAKLRELIEKSRSRLENLALEFTRLEKSVKSGNFSVS